MSTFIFYFLFFAQSDWDTARRFGKGSDWFILKETPCIPQNIIYSAQSMTWLGSRINKDILILILIILILILSFNLQLSLQCIMHASCMVLYWYWLCIHTGIVHGKIKSFYLFFWWQVCVFCLCFFRESVPLQSLASLSRITYNGKYEFKISYKKEEWWMWVPL